MTPTPKFKIGEKVIFNDMVLTIQVIRNYQDYCWVYDFFPSEGTILPFHFTGISESQIRSADKKWWQFWK